ncbi:MAG TPA: NAD(P)/FAD-dependent oxidoreductase, partial [Candidatus Saccharimonadales bacterium]|nr:NAD(P)/FAD-dependent oxidoreductase [Candidatus Saccharimonadales bacterium]
AQNVAYRCREAGWSVAVIDSRPFGGTCQLRGCDPKKVLVGASELVDWSHRMQGKGISAPTGSIDWPDLIRFKRTFTDPVPEQNEQSFEQAGIIARHGRAHFVDRTSVQVDDDIFIGRHVVIATGARHATLGIPGDEHLTTSTQFLELDQLPRRITLVGGGYIAFEFAHIAARAGAQVRMLHRGNRPLKHFDPDLVATLMRATQELGVEVRLQTQVTAVERQAGRLVVHASAEGLEQTFEADLAVHAAGRVPEIADLDLEAAGVARSDDGVTVNDFLQSVSNPAVYAAGDSVASGGFPLTPVAGMQGGIVATNLLEGNHATPNYAGIPSVVFTTPPLARVGLSEEAARAQGLRFVTHHEDTSGWYSSRRVALPHTGFKTLVEEGTGRILGAHLLGLHAEEVINLFALAIRTGLRANDLKETVYAYPTSASDMSYML